MRRARIPSEVMPGQGGEIIVLDSATAHYLRDVLRLEAGERVELFDGTGIGWVCELHDVGESVSARAIKQSERETESNLAITLVHAIPKGDRWEWMIEKATELGVARIIPMVTGRSVVRIPEKKIARKVERWTKIADEAARQSERLITPEIAPPSTFGDSLKTVTADLFLFGHPSEASQAMPTSLSSVAFWIGPEGGLTDAEVEQLIDAGALPYSLGPRILRCETAGVVATTLLQRRWGDLG